MMLPREGMDADKCDQSPLILMQDLSSILSCYWSTFLQGSRQPVHISSCKAESVTMRYSVEQKAHNWHIKTPKSHSHAARDIAIAVVIRSFAQRKPRSHLKGTTHDD